MAKLFHAVGVSLRAGQWAKLQGVNRVSLAALKFLVDLAPVVQRPDNFILWISHYPTVSICAKISVFPLVQANMHTLTTVKFGSVRKPWTTFNVKHILDPE